LTPGRYVGSEVIDEDDEQFEMKIEGLIAELEQQFEESNSLERSIKKSLKELNYGLGK